MTGPRDARSVSLLLGALFGLGALGSSSVTVVLPMMAAEFDVSVGLVAWSVSAYLLMLAVTTAVYGRVSDLIGIRIPFLVGTALLATGALVSAVAPSFPVLLGARLVQGIGAAAAPTLGVAILTARYSGVHRGLALGRLAATTAAVSGLGPLLGGAVEDLVGWRAVMALPVLGLLVLPGIWRTLTGGGTGARLDLRGALLVCVTSGGLLLLVQSPSTGAAAAAVGAVLLVVGTPLVITHVRRRPEGFLPLSVTRNRAVVRSAIAAGTVPAAWFALLLGVPVALVESGWQGWQVGLWMLPSVVVAVLMPPWTARLLAGRGGRWVLSVAAVIAAVAMLAAAWASASAWGGAVALSVVCISVAYGLGQPAMLATVGNAVAADVRGVALGVAMLIFMVAGSVGAAVVAGLGDVIGIAGSLLVLAVLPLLALPLLRGVPMPDDT